MRGLCGEGEVIVSNDADRERIRLMRDLAILNAFGKPAALVHSAYTRDIEPLSSIVAFAGKPDGKATWTIVERMLGPAGFRPKY